MVSSWESIADLPENGQAENSLRVPSEYGTEGRGYAGKIAGPESTFGAGIGYPHRVKLPAVQPTED